MITETKLALEMLENLKNKLMGLQGLKTCDPIHYYKSMHDGMDPDEAWTLFEGFVTDIDLWQEISDVTALIARESNG